jgi:hypothetical protein
MILIEDTRQQRGKHDNVHKYCKSIGVEIYPLTLAVGDYMLGCLIDGEIKPYGDKSVDTKQSIGELANDLVNDDFGLNRKYRKCYEQNIHLIVLIEEDGYTNLSDICKWKNKHGKLSGRQLMEKMYRLHVSYGVEFLFCNRKETGKKY